MNKPWVDSLTLEQFDTMAREYANSRGFQADGVAALYQHTFTPANDDEETSSHTDHITFNNRQRLIIVAERFSGEIEQTLRYLRTRLGIYVTGLQFGVHMAGTDTVVLTNVVVGREIAAVAAAKSTSSHDPITAQSEPDEPIVARVTSDFVRRAATGIEVWIESYGNPDLTFQRGAGSRRYIRVRGKSAVDLLPEVCPTIM